MTAEHHAVTARHWLAHAPLGFRQEVAACGRPGSRPTFATRAACARQQWLFVEPCMQEPLMVTPLGSDVHPHFKLPNAQGRALKRYENMVGWLGQAEAKRMQCRRRQDGLDLDRVRDVRVALDDLHRGGCRLRAAV